MKRFERPLRQAVAALLLTGITFRVWQVFIGMMSENFQAPARLVHMTVDGANYSAVGRRLAMSSEPLMAESIHYSVGMQVYVAAVMRFLQSDQVGPLKLLNFAFFGGILFLLYQMGLKATRSRHWALFGVFIAASSELLVAYIPVVQYEILIAFLFLLGTAALVLRPDPRRCLGAGVIVAICAIFRAHFVLVLPGYALGLWLLDPTRAGLRTRVAPLLLGFLFLALPWNSYYSIRQKQVFFFQEIFTFRLSLHPDSTGKNFPKPTVEQIREPSGVAFIVQEPKSYGRLLVERSQYFLGIAPDIWMVESCWSQLLAGVVGGSIELARKLVVAFSLVLLGLGAWAAVKERQGWALLLLSMLVAVSIPQLLINSTTRFLVPALPGWLFFDMLGIRELSRLMRRMFAKIACGRRDESSGFEVESWD